MEENSKQNSIIEPIKSQNQKEDQQIQKELNQVCDGFRSNQDQENIQFMSKQLEDQNISLELFDITILKRLKSKIQRATVGQKFQQAASCNNIILKPGNLDSIPSCTFTIIIGETFGSKDSQKIDLSQNKEDLKQQEINSEKILPKENQFQSLKQQQDQSQALEEKNQFEQKDIPNFSTQTIQGSEKNIGSNQQISEFPLKNIQHQYQQYLALSQINDQSKLNQHNEVISKQQDQNKEWLFYSKHIKNAVSFKNTYEICQSEYIIKQIIEYNFEEYQYYNQYNFGHLNQNESIEQQNDDDDDDDAQIVQRQWNEDIFRHTNNEEFQSEVFKQHRTKIIDKLKENQFYLCKVIISNGKEDLIVGFRSEDVYENVYKIIYSPHQSEIKLEILLIQTLGFTVEHYQIEEENIHILALQRDNIKAILHSFEYLINFQFIKSSLENYYEINSQDSFFCGQCNKSKICKFINCFSNTKIRILTFLKIKKLFYCEFKQNEVEGVILQLSQEEFVKEYKYFILNLILSYLQLEKTNQKEQQIQDDSYQKGNKENNQQAEKEISQNRKDQQRDQSLQEEIIENRGLNEGKNDDQIEESNSEKKKKQFYTDKKSEDSVQQHIKQESIGEQQLDLIKLVNEYQYKEYQIVIKEIINADKNLVESEKYLREWDFKKFKEINNHQFSKIFSEEQTTIIQMLLNTNHYLCKCFSELKTNQDIFVGYQSINSDIYIDYVYIIKYDPLQSQIDQYLLFQKFYEETYHFVIQDFIHIFTFQKDNFVQIYYKFESLNNNLIKTSEWTKEYFEEINKDTIINLEKCNKCRECQRSRECSEYSYFRQFQQQKDSILELLQQRNYYLCEYVNKGGEGIIFQGYKQSFKGKSDLVFKIQFDCSLEGLQEELKILKLFEQYIFVVKFFDFIKINQNVSVLVLEKCQFSLKDQLDQINNQQEFPLDTLLQMIFNLLDGLIQLRIYSIIHFDIKPQNILVSGSGKYLYTDFGISSTKKGNQQTAVKGLTKLFASPEQMQNHVDVDFQSDVYSLGKTFQIILNLFQEIQKQNYLEIVNKFMKIIKENMLQTQQKQRLSCLELSIKFFQEILSQKECEQFLKYYVQEMKSIIKLQPFDSNKEIPYFFQIQLYYNLNILTLQEHFIDSENYQQQYLHIAETLSQIGNCYLNIGEQEKALEYYLRSLELRKQFYVDNYSDILSSQNDIANCYFYLGNYKKSLKYELENLEIMRLFNDYSQQMVISLNNIASYFNHLADYNKALKFLFKALSIESKYSKDDNLKWSACLYNLACCMKNLGKYQEALDYCLQSLQLKKKIYLDSHPSIAQTLDMIGLCYKSLGDNKQSLQYLEESLQMRRLLFQDNHPQIAQSLNHIGLLYLQISQYQKALDFSLESLSMKQKIWKQVHPNTATSLSNVGLCYQNLCDYQKAIDYYTQSLQMTKQIFQENHPELANTLFCLANCFEENNQSKKALRYALESLEMRKQFLKSNHPDIINSLNSAGSFIMKVGQFEKALKYLEKSLKIAKQTLKQKNNLIITSLLNNIGTCYFSLGNLEKALEYCLESLEIRKQMYQDSPNRELMISFFNVGKLYFDQGEFQKSLEYSLKSLEISQKLFLNKHTSTQISLQLTGLCYLKLQDYQQSKDYLLSSLQLAKELLSKDHASISLFLYNLSVVYKKLKDYKNGMLSSLESIEILNASSQENNNLEIAQSLCDIAIHYQKLGDFKIALDYHLQSLKMKYQVLEENDSEILFSFKKLAKLYYADKDYNNAVKTQLEYLSKLKQKFLEEKQEQDERFIKIYDFIEKCYENMGDEQNLKLYKQQKDQIKQQIEAQSKSD